MSITAREVLAQMGKAKRKGGGRERRHWTYEEKASMVAEVAAGEAVPAVAARHGVNATLLWAWKRQHSEGKLKRPNGANGHAAASVPPGSIVHTHYQGAEAPATATRWRVSSSAADETFDTQAEALAAYIAATAQPGVTGLGLWRSVSVQVKVIAEVKE